MTTCIKPEGISESFVEVEKIFNDALLRTLRIDLIRTVALPERNLQATVANYDDETVLLDEYSDFKSVNELTVEESARGLGIAVGVFYNALIQNAEMKGHKVVTDLFENNLRFNYVFNPLPSVVDPAGLIPGWIPFRVQFASSNDRPASITKGQMTLQNLEGKSK
jgi:hypothetical protein